MGHYTDLLVLRRGRQLNLNLSSAQLHLAVWPGGSYLPSLSLCFPFCKMGIMTAAASLGSCVDEMNQVAREGAGELLLLGVLPLQLFLPLT